MSHLPARRNVLSGVALVVAMACAAGAATEPEVRYPAKDFAKLDTLEGVMLTKADKTFGAKDYRGASAAYDAFIADFPKSKALPYALLRKARCIHLDNKRYEAIRAYNEVLDYFPNAVAYAAPALYHIGACHLQNGDVRKAMKAWAKMALDKDYCTHPLAAGAVNQLAENLAKQGKTDKAAEYYAQVAADFRAAYPDAANRAIQQVILHYVRRRPDEPKLRAVYQRTKGFDERPRKLPDDLAADPYYWRIVRHYVKRHGTFSKDDEAKRRACFGYWAQQLDGKLPKSDDFQIDLAAFWLAHDGDKAKWRQRLDAQFAKHQKPGDYDRIVQWIAACHADKQKALSYYQKLDLAKMSNAQLIALMRVLFDQLGDAKMAANVFYKIRFNNMSDRDKRGLISYLWYKGTDDLIAATCAAFTDRDAGHLELLRYYHWRRNIPKAMPIAKKLVLVPKYSAEALWKRAEMLQWSKKFKEALKAYQQCDNPPGNLWRIAECFVALGQMNSAVAQLREIENFFKDSAPEACLRIAFVYRDHKLKDKYIAQLRGVLKKYPKSGQSSRAHQELERMGIKIGGGVDAD